MQIYGPSQVHGAQPLNGPHSSRGVQAGSSPTTTSIGDRLDISAAGELAGRLADIPEIRADRVAQIRAAIQDGSYETPDKLGGALDRLLDELT